MIQSPPGQDALAEVRVILVGSTGLDAALRRDPSIELIRSRTPLDAIGELADPIDQTSPTRSVVIVGGETARGDVVQTRQFIEGLRLIDPYVRVLRVRPGDGGRSGPVTGESDLFDAQVSPDDPLDELVAVIRGTRRATRATSQISDQGTPAAVAGAPRTLNGSGPGRSAPPAPSPWVRASGGSHRASAQALTPNPGDDGDRRAPLEPARDPHRGEDRGPESFVERKPTRAAVGDEALAAEVARGRDCVPLALEILRARVAPARIEFIEGAGPQSGPDHPGGPSSLSASVAWGHTVYGRLVADQIAPADLQRQADWLAAWVRLGAQTRDLRDAAYRDPLTGAWNRRYFDRFMDAALAKSRDGRHALTILMFDIDDFKVYNDRYGHAAGDEILMEVVRLLQATIRPTDRVCRIGGDEFAVVFYEPTGPREAGSRHPSSFFDIAKRFQKQVWEHRFPKLGAQAPGTLTVSGGLATFPWDGATPQELLDKADRLAMDSKRLGKNAITLGQGAMRACHGQE